MSGSGKAQGSEARPGGGLREELPSALLGGVISGVLCVTVAVSLAALIFTGKAAKHLGPAVGLALISAVVLAVVGAARSAARPAVFGVQEKPAILLALAASALGERVAPDRLLATLAVACGGASLGTGVCLLLIGRFRLGKVVRFIPYPVVGGFLAGTGWLLVLGSLGVLVGDEVTLSRLAVLAAPGAPIKWVPGALFGVVLWLALRRSPHHLTLPGLLVGGSLVFYAALAALTGQIWKFFAVVLLTVISALLYSSAFEVSTNRDLDLDHELRVTGAANIASGLLMGMPGFRLLSPSLLSYKLGARGRLPGFIAAGVCALPLALGLRVFGYVPKAVLAGLLLSAGISFLEETVVDTARKLPRLEWLLVVALLAVVAAWGILPAIGAGILVASVLFAASYAKVGAIQASVTGATLRSEAARSEAESALLGAQGHRVHVLRLQGYLFFGTAHALLEDAKSRLSGDQRARFLVLDFARVQGLDSSAVQSFQRLRAMAASAGAALVLTQVPRGVEQLLLRGNVLGEGSPIRIRADLDRGLELCEDELIAESEARPPDEGALARERAREKRVACLVEAIAGHAERVEVAPGEEVYRAGSPASDLVVVETGELSAFATADGRERRLRVMGPGSIVGEIGLYLGQARTATVRATRPSVLHRLGRAGLDKLAREAPERAALVHETIATVLADRLADATSSSEAWLR